ncbi:LRR receptor-like serine/threonine-protein kinase precursor [Actinidia chinensis var. chinensis]|uniref:non-specific serine/threonine protein kinase n=1 Tax=Actinidia chinensis var. chinensis TaxID=1590841 RepID=A0A2R6R082_ACTCC|nr:LRR receptor-like serine/threonine-protein kinase precursor [Actinidia chinensis var. chinensis]
MRIEGSRHSKLLTRSRNKLVHGQIPQDKSGFISIDCGIQEGYTEESKYYSSDANFVDTGINYNVSAEYRAADLDPRLASLRSFPQGTRNCYTLRPEQGKNNSYLIRAWFLYGNYDGQNSFPKFDLYIGVNLWEKIGISNNASYKTEIMYVPSTDYIHVCLLNTGAGTPFISALELKQLNGTVYKSQSGCMAPYVRNYVGSYRGGDQAIADDLGRVWSYYNMSNTESISTYFPINSQSSNDYELPLQIMKYGAKPLNDSDPLKYYLDQGGSTTSFYLYLHFCDVEEHKGNDIREFDILLNGQPWLESIVPRYQLTTTVTNEIPIWGGGFGELWLSIVKTNRSTLPPILNALEIYVEKELPQSPTDPEDVDAMVNISLTYAVKRNWQGDPCVPMTFSWSGVNCSYNGNNSPQVKSLNLSSSDLTGEIAPALSALKSVRYLDLSNNSLTGTVPEFLAELPALEILNLAGNKLTGSIPKALTEKSSLLLTVDGNPDLCLSISCEQKKKKTNQNTVAIIVSIVATVVFLSAIAILWSLWRRRRAALKPNGAGRTLKSKNRRFSYSEVVSVTNNFERVIGKGGFGTVYLGHLEDGTEVAVKMLSRSSTQGSEQFWTEAELLTTIHHRNLASLIGYCDEASNTALIYEYMANGNLQECLLDRNRAVLTWEQRLQIAVDAAHALEYLHNGCKPPIIHRDIKTANILLDDKLQAKVADFGLSRIFPIEDGDHGTHVTTVVMGTFGYLDPEYYITRRLTKKSDVYSFGVVLLELITGQPAIIKSDDNTHIVQWVMPNLERGEISNIADPKIEGEFDSNSMWKALEAAMACVPSNSLQRPTMSEVVVELNECLEMVIASGRDLEMTEISKTTSSNGTDFLSNTLDVDSSMSLPQAR